MDLVPANGHRQRQPVPAQPRPSQLYAIKANFDLLSVPDRLAPTWEQWFDPRKS
jgi:hypothetical protein